MIKAIIFDLWETLGTKNVGVSNSLREKFGIEKTPDFLKKYEQAIQLKPWKFQTEMARNFLQSFSLPVNTESVEFIIELFNRAITQATLFPGMKSLLQELHRKHKICLLSNTTIFEAEILKRWGIQEFFDAEIYSWQLGSLKPARKNFEEACIKLGVSPEECVFIDDSEQNVQAAKDFGMQTIVFTGVEKLRDTLLLEDVKDVINS